MFCVHVVLPYAKAILFRLFGDHVYREAGLVDVSS